MKILRPAFRNTKNIISFILYPISLILLLVLYLKKNLKQKKFQIKTICVGNIFIGGTGKTSLSIAIFKIVNKKFKTTFIKKKYTNQLDEKRLLAKYGNVIFEDERIKALNIAQKNYKMAILDDGLQQKNIKYDLRIVREKFSEIKNYDLVFIIGDNPDRKFINKIKTIKKNSNIFFANYSVSNLSKFNLKKKYLIFSGIGNPHEFENTLLKSKFKIEKKIIFPDLYSYTEIDLKMIKDLAKRI